VVDEPVPQRRRPFGLEVVLDGVDRLKGMEKIDLLALESPFERS
jgi:hypothetical protein